MNTLAVLSPDNSVKRFTRAFYVDGEHYRADVWLCTHSHVAESCCGIARTTRVPFKEGTVPGLQPHGGSCKDQNGLYPLKPLCVCSIPHCAVDYNAR